MDESKAQNEQVREKEEISLVGFLDDNEPTSKWDTKASVFNNLFGEIEYRFRLYRALHPEDKDIRREDIMLTLRDGFFDGDDICVDCFVKVIKDGKEGDIISQYVRFCRVFDEQVKIHGKTLKAVEETIRICKDEKVLEEYLERQREEVIDIMTTLFDQETIMKNHDATVRREAEKKTQKDMAGLMSFLASNGRSDDIVKAGQDENFLNKLLADFRGGLMVVK